MAEATPSPAPTGPIDPKLLQLFKNIADNPTDIVVGQFRGYMEDLIRITAAGVAKATQYAVGDFRIVLDDLTANTSEYSFEDEFGVWLYGNGAAVSQSTWAELYAKWGANKWGADAGGNFLLPDTRGRNLVLCGTHADVDLGDNDGTSEANRRPKHSHTNGLSVSGTFGSSTHTHAGPAHTHGVGTLATGSAGLHSHQITQTGANGVVNYGTGVLETDTHTGHTHTVTGATASDGTGATGSPSATASPSLSGTIGSTGGTNDAPSYIVIGSAVFRAR